MKNYNILDILANIDPVAAAPVVKSSSQSKYSFGIVNSEGNGKRISINKSLTADLDLEDSIELLPCPDGILLIGSHLGSEYASSCNLKGSAKKIGYSAAIVQLLVDYYHLDFSDHTSCTFRDITLQTFNNTTVAVVNMLDSSLSE